MTDDELYALAGAFPLDFNEFSIECGMLVFPSLTPNSQAEVLEARNGTLFDAQHEWPFAISAMGFKHPPFVQRLAPSSPTNLRTAILRGADLLYWTFPNAFKHIKPGTHVETIETLVGEPLWRAITVLYRATNAKGDPLIWAIEHGFLASFSVTYTPLEAHRTLGQLWSHHLCSSR